jgi:hypothetical protein
MEDSDCGPTSETNSHSDSDRFQRWDREDGRQVFRRGEVLHRQTGAWTRSVHSLLSHLESVGFTAAPRIVGSGFDSEGLETLTFIEGEFIQPGPWTIEGAAAVGRLLSDLHKATASYQPAADAVWRPWFGRELGGATKIIGHCDAGPWNIVARNGFPVALIDWDFAGPVDPLVDLAQACWLNAKLHSDDVAVIEGLPALEERARQLRAIVDGYGLDPERRHGLVRLMIDFAVHSTANEADEFGITPKAKTADGLWGMAWRARGAAWMLRHERVLQEALG